MGKPDEYFSTFVCPPEWAGSSLCFGLDTEAEGLPFGHTDLGAEGQTVSLDLAHAGRAGVTLKPGTTYHYRVIAATSVFTEDTTQWEGPTVEGADQTFTTPGTGQSPSEVVTEPAEPSGQAKQEPKSEPPAPMVTPLVVTSPSIKKTTELKPLTKAQKLTNALKACESKPKKQWATCKRQARRKYGKTSYKIGKQASKKK